jgi:serine/threonine protein kinase
MDLQKLKPDKRRPSANEGRNNSLTLGRARTMQGIILGTRIYRSPEQAKGKAVTKARDLWASGCLLYRIAAES